MLQSWEEQGMTKILEVLQVCSRGEGRPSAIGNLARRREQIENEAVQ
jgi:hypothetical protein